MKNYVSQLQRVGLGCYSTASINRVKTKQQLCLKQRIATTTLHMNMILINSNQQHTDVNKSSTGIDLLWAGSCLTCTVYRALHNCTLSPTLAGRQTYFPPTAASSSLAVIPSCHSHFPTGSQPGFPQQRSKRSFPLPEISIGGLTRT